MLRFQSAEELSLSQGSPWKLSSITFFIYGRIESRNVPNALKIFSFIYIDKFEVFCYYIICQRTNLVVQEFCAHDNADASLLRSAIDLVIAFRPHL